MLAWLLIIAFVALLILAALTDWQTRRIPNRITGAIAFLYLPFVFSHPGDIAWPAAVLVALACFAGGFILFARRVLGGGDVKLITAVSLWAGSPFLASFTIVMSLTGGVLALGVLAWQRFAWMIAPTSRREPTDER
jgi:prepilin peptidase CpaA